MTTEPVLKVSCSHLPPAAVTEALHDGVDLLLEHLGQFGAVLVHARRLPVVQPRVVEHQPHVVHVLPRLLILTRVQFALDSGQVYGVLHDIEVVLKIEEETPSKSSQTCTHTVFTFLKMIQ